jgi:predicted NUDIX family phosphoesterase
MELQNQLLNQSSLFHETLENEFSGDDTLKDVKVYILMEYDQRVIIKFTFNEQCNANQIVEGLAAHFREDAYSLRSVQFWIGEIKRGREDLHDAQRSGRRPSKV